MPVDYKPRLNVDISEEQDTKLRKLIPWGLKHQLFSVIVDELIQILEEHGEMAIGAILAKRISVLEIIRAKEKRRGKPK